MPIDSGNLALKGFLPFVDRFPTDLELYRIMTTKLGEVSEGKKE